MSRFVDRGAITAAYVGIGMAVTIVVSFLLFIPIEWIIWLLAIPSGCSSATTRTSARTVGPARGAGSSSTGLFAGVRDGSDRGRSCCSRSRRSSSTPTAASATPGQGGPIRCRRGADCVYQRYLEAGADRSSRRRGDRCRLVHALLLGRAVRQCRHDPRPDDARRRSAAPRCTAFPPEARGPAVPAPARPPARGRDPSRLAARGGPPGWDRR